MKAWFSCSRHTNQQFQFLHPPLQPLQVDLRVCFMYRNEIDMNIFKLCLFYNIVFTMRRGIILKYVLGHQAIFETNPGIINDIIDDITDDVINDIINDQ